MKEVKEIKKVDFVGTVVERIKDLIKIKNDIENKVILGELEIVKSNLIISKKFFKILTGKDYEVVYGDKSSANSPRVGATVTH